MSLKNELTSITKSASNQKWYQAERALGRAFWRIDIHDAIRIKIAFMRTYLEETNHSEFSWVAEWLDILETLTHKPIAFNEQQFGFWQKYFKINTTSRNAEAFFQGLWYSNGAYHWFIGAPYDTERYQTMCTSALTPAVVCTIVARLDVCLIENHPEIYANYQHQFQMTKFIEEWTQAEIDNYQEITRQYKQAAYEKHRDLWLEVVQLFKVIPKSSENN